MAHCSHRLDTLSYPQRHVPERPHGGRPRTRVPERASQNTAAGLSKTGLIPYLASYSIFLSGRAWDQMRNTVDYSFCNVKIAAAHGGISVGKDGPTHHSITDIATMRALPEMTVIVPADGAEAARWVPLVAEYDGPVYLRLSRAGALPAHNEDFALRIGLGLTLRRGDDVSLVATGTMEERAQRPSADGRLPATTTDPDGTRP